MDIRKKIEKIKNQMKTAGMVAAFGTMTLNSSAQNVTSKFPMFIVFVSPSSTEKNEE